MRTSIWDISKDTIERLGIHMPTFNKGTFKRGAELIEYEAKPIKQFKISSIFRWYQPYAPGDAVEFTLSLKGIGGTFGGVEIFARQNGGEFKQVVNLAVKKTEQTHNIPPIILGGQGSVDYYMRSLGFPNPTVLLASVEPTHNDTFMLIVLGAILGCIGSVVAGLILAHFGIGISK